MAEAVETKPVSLGIREKHEMIKNVISYVLELGGYVIVHDNGMISMANTPSDPILLSSKKGQSGNPLVVYDVNPSIQNGLIINPFVEPIGSKSIERIWFNSQTNKTHTNVFARILEYLVENAVKAATGVEITNEYIVHALSGIVNNADNKTSAEFARIIKQLPEYDGGLDDDVLKECMLITDQPSPANFLSITIRQQDKLSYIRTFFQDEEGEFKKNFGNKIRKKTWTLIESIFKEIYGVSELDKPFYIESTDSIRCPGFVTYLRVLIKSWNRFIPYLQFLYSEAEADDMIAKIMYLENSIPHLDALANISGWARGTPTGELTLSDGSMPDGMDPNNSPEPIVRQTPMAPVAPMPREHAPVYAEAPKYEPAAVEEQPKPTNSPYSTRSIYDLENDSRRDRRDDRDRYRREDSDRDRRDYDDRYYRRDRDDRNYDRYDRYDRYDNRRREYSRDRYDTRRRSYDRDRDDYNPGRRVI